MLTAIIIYIGIGFITACIFYALSISKNGKITDTDMGALIVGLICLWWPIVATVLVVLIITGLTGRGIITLVNFTHNLWNNSNV